MPTKDVQSSRVGLHMVRVSLKKSLCNSDTRNRSFQLRLKRCETCSTRRLAWKRRRTLQPSFRSQRIVHFPEGRLERLDSLLAAALAHVQARAVLHLRQVLAAECLPDIVETHSHPHLQDHEHLVCAPPRKIRPFEAETACDWEHHCHEAVVCPQSQWDIKTLLGDQQRK